MALVSVGWAEPHYMTHLLPQQPKATTTKLRLAHHTHTHTRSYLYDNGTIDFVCMRWGGLQNTIQWGRRVRAGQQVRACV